MDDIALSMSSRPLFSPTAFDGLSAAVRSRPFEPGAGEILMPITSHTALALSTTALATLLIAAPALAQEVPPATTTGSAGTTTRVNEQPIGVAQSAPAAGRTTSAAPAETATAAPAPGGDLDAIVVTARRREENIQSVPVSIAAFSGTALAEKGIRATTDIQRLVPGVVFTGAGSDANTTFSIRGQGKFVIGAGLPSVISYFNEVPLPSWGSVLPTFDVANVQVLKGPQGTLFGRNTTGGAVLLYSQKPTYKLGGYVEGTLGSYAWRALQGAINLPIVDGAIALRIAGDYEKRRGYTKQLGVGRDQDELDSRAIRASLLIEPARGVSNTTVFDYYHKNTGYSGIIALGATATPLYNFGSAVFGPQAGPLIDAGFHCRVSIDCDVDLQLARQKQIGPRRTYSDVANSDRTTIYGVSNTTVVNLGESLTFKNIFGYRVNHVHQEANTDGLPVALINTFTERNDRQVSNEVQLAGSFLNKRATFLLGGFYLDTRPNGPEGLSTDLFRPAFIPEFVPFIGSVSNNLYTDRSKALFASGSFAIVHNVKINAGYRYTWDREGVCAFVTQPSNAPFLSGPDACRSTTGAFISSVKFKAPTWSVGIDWQATPDVFAYAVVRRGYRAGGINTPRLGGIFSPYQFFTPQTLTDTEVGVKTNWRAGSLHGRFNISAFRGNFKNLQRPITALPPNSDGDNNPATDPSNTTLIVNSGKSRVQGFEIDTAIYPAAGLSFNAGISYLNSKYTDFTVPTVFAPFAGGEAVFDNAPKWGYTLATRYQLPVELAGAKVTFGADYYHTSSYRVGNLGIPGYGLANAQIEISNIIRAPVTATFFVSNVFDKLYIRNTSLSGTSPGVFSAGYGEPRMYGARLRLNF